MPSVLSAWYKINVATEMLVFGETYTHSVKLSRLVKWNFLTSAVLQKLMYFCQVLEYYRWVESDSAESMFFLSNLPGTSHALRLGLLTSEVQAAGVMERTIFSN